MKADLLHRPLAPPTIAAVDIDPAEVKHVPIAAGFGDMAKTGQQGRRGIGTDRAVEGAPVVQRIGERPHIADPGWFVADDQGEDSHRLAVGADDERPQPLTAAEVPPIEFEPIEGMEKAGLGSLRQQGVPQEAVVGQSLDVVDFFDVNHRIWATAKCSPRRHGEHGGKTRASDMPGLGGDFRRPPPAYRKVNGANELRVHSAV